MNRRNSTNGNGRKPRKSVNRDSNDNGSGPSRFRPNPGRQAFFVVIALIGIGIGYGAGFLFKPDAPPPAAKEPTSAYQPPVGSDAGARPVLPEHAPATAGKAPRAYEEALPRDIVVNGLKDAPQASSPVAAEPKDEPKAQQETPAPRTEAFTARPQAPKAIETPTPKETRKVSLPPDDPSLPPLRRYAVPVADAAGRPRIAIVMDDLGIDRPRTARTIRLPGPLTLSFLTYAGGLGEQTRAAREAGHELLMHVPMEPGSVDVDPGPNVLLTGLPPEELVASLSWNLEQFDAFVGISNHMGSRFTADAAGMGVVMAELKRRGLLFLDSVTASNSVGRRAARAAGVPSTVRNVFLDHEDNVAAIERQLAEVERLAKRNGTAVAIGHPREATLSALGRWLDGIEAKGFQLVPISALVR